MVCNHYKIEGALGRKNSPDCLQNRYFVPDLVSVPNSIFYFLNLSDLIMS